jgi:cysteine desulfurase / selenocysteine lyase
MIQSQDFQKIRALFPILESRKIVYLDSAATSLRPRPVIDRVTQYESYQVSNIHRSGHTLAARGTEMFEQVRSQVALLLDAENPSEIIFTRGTTESINLVAASYGETNLKAGDIIALTELEHHSNIVPWQLLAGKVGARLEIIKIASDGNISEPDYKRVLALRPKIVAITACSNVLGTILPLKRYIEEAHATGALVAVDAAQAVPHMPISVRDLNCDFLSFSGHKMCAPFGAGVLYAKAQHLEKMAPYQSGGSMISQVSWETTTWADLPHKFEAGTQNISGVIGLGAAIDFMNQIGFEKIEKYETELAEFARSEMSSISGLEIYGSAKHRGAIIPFNVEGLHASDVGDILDQQGVAVRVGHHCCQPLLKVLGTPSTLRASFSFYNDEQDVAALKNAILKAKELLI